LQQLLGVSLIAGDFGFQFFLLLKDLFVFCIENQFCIFTSNFMMTAKLISTPVC
jgi:hypothetical protein